MIKVSYTVKRGKKIPQKLKMLNDRLSDRTAPMNELKTYMVHRWRDNFESNGGVYGKWAPLSPRSWRRGDNHGGIPLHLTGALFFNVMRQSNQGKVSQTKVTWAFRNGPPSYPLSHQFGYNPHFNQPPRKIWDMNGDDEAHAERVIDAWVDQQVRSIFR